MNSTDTAVLEIDEVVTMPTMTPLRKTVKSALEDYLLQLGDQEPVNFYQFVLEQIEAPLLEVVMRLTKNNQLKAAQLLGLSRGTLRKKLKQYNLDY